MHVRVCRDCGEEYRPEIARCADCGGELLDRYEGEEGAPVGGEPPPAGETPAEAEASPDEPEEGPLYSGSIVDLEPLVDALVAADVPHHVRSKDGKHFVLSVTRENFEPALKALRPFRGR